MRWAELLALRNADLNRQLGNITEKLTALQMEIGSIRRPVGKIGKLEKVEEEG